jgi:hypothetical protein
LNPIDRKRLKNQAMGAIIAATPILSSVPLLSLPVSDARAFDRTTGVAG